MRANRCIQSAADRIPRRGDFPFDDTGFLDGAERVFGPLFVTPDGRWTSLADERVMRQKGL